jgi:redox-sensitive bicupin YhaK (pirin superfamily)
VRIDAAEEARVLLIAGRPLGEPIAQYGPFVMNTEQEIYQAVADYRAGRLAA